MNDEAAFVAAIAAAPDDHHLPLVFADWLDDHGDPRGQWLRHYAVRGWLPPTYENPVLKLLESLAKNKRVIDVRRAAEVIGEPLVPGLVELLKHEKPRVREQACMCMRKIGKRAKAAVPALLDALASSEHNVREQAAKALQGIGTDEVTNTDQLKAALTDDNWNVRHLASRALGKMGAKGSVLQELVEKFDSPDAADRIEVIESLMQLGTADAVPTFERAIDDPEPEVREKAVDALGRQGYPEMVPGLCRAMRDPVARVRASAAGQFHYSGKTPEAVTALTALLDDPVPEVRVAACATLSKASGSLAKELVPRFLALLGDLSRTVYLSAISALGALAKGDQAALNALIAELNNRDPVQRAEVIRAVAAVGHNGSEALAALVPRISDTNGDVAQVAAEVIGHWTKLPASLAAPLLARLAWVGETDTYGWETNTVLTTLGKIEPPPAAVVEALRACVRNPPQGYGQTAALEALAALGPAAAAAIPDIVAILNAGDGNQNYYKSQAAVRALARVGGLGELAALLDGPSDNARWSALQATNELGAAALPLLPAMLRLYRTADEWRHRQVVGAIRNLGPGAVAALPDLFGALEAAGPWHDKWYTLQALQGFGPALVPYLPRLIELSRRPESAELLGSFAALFATFAPGEPAVREALRELLRAAAPGEETDWNLHARQTARQACAAALLTFNDAALLPDLAPLVTDPEAVIRTALVGQLDRLDTPAVLPLIRQLLADANDDVRLRAVEVLARRADASDETIAALVRAVEDRTPKVRRAAIDALGKLNVGTDAVLAALSAATEDADKKVAERAGVALRKLTPKEPKKAPGPAKGKKKPK